ncbi:VWFA and cache domain-containing protein 1-like [Lingula anatina]|uniref:VWFA and cache domain-containing protein 1-like n=1 Tax=Lingula anatina TaxID=7574 RepID=A0A1S3J002_LINAN|nr:VWFA and cache domain-containing protein 1-like [Lingula anatina]|eukprot:XP_013403576.1 VWFA and cache domain-containing protein 1-like [Lingula anatina]
MAAAGLVVWCNVCIFLLALLSERTCSTQDKEFSPGATESDALKLRNEGYTSIKTPSYSNEDEWTYANSGEQVDPKKMLMEGINLQWEARKLISAFRNLTNEEMGVTYLQGIYDSLSYDTTAIREEEVIKKLSKKLKTKFQNYLDILDAVKKRVENLYNFHLLRPITQAFDCCNLTDYGSSPENPFYTNMSKLVTCDFLPPHLSKDAFNPGRNLTEVFKGNQNGNPQLKWQLMWQYFISAQGVHNEFPAHGVRENCPKFYDARHRDVYVNTLQPQTKNVVLVLDQGNSLSSNQLKTVKAVAKHLLGSLSEHDRVGLIGVSNTIGHPRDDEDPCVSNKLVPFTLEVKYYFEKFITEAVKQDAPTNHSLGLETAFRMIRSTLQEHENQTIKEDAMIMYISRGLLTSLTDAKDVMEVIAVENGKLGNKVVINTYAVIGDGKPVMFEKSFLENVANQNFEKYDVQSRHPLPVRPGQSLSVNTTDSLSTSVGTFFQAFNRSIEDRPRFSLPYADQTGAGLVMSISQPCLHQGKVLGVAGVDLHFGEMVEDITYFQQEVFAYAFLLDQHGYMVMHPSLSRPIFTKYQPMHTDVSHFENYEGFERVKHMILSATEGRTSLTVHAKENTQSNLSLLPDGKTVIYRYLWKRIENTPFILVLKVAVDSEYSGVTNAPVPNSLLYHRLDLIPHNTCMHLKQLATLEASTVFLSASAFTSPFEHLNKPENKKDAKEVVQSYVAYLGDDTKLIANPGLKPEVRDDVAAVSRINSQWLQQFKKSKLNDYIVRRYVATPSGVFRLFPGGLIEKKFDPTKRPWYERAIENPGSVVLTEPYLDVYGAGYIATISHTVYEGRPGGKHSSSDRIVAVMGIDITMRYFYKLLREAMPHCEDKNIRCFILDNKGYLVAHPGLIEPSENGPEEQRHITRMESLVANDILHHKGFVEKKLCNSFSDRTIQRYYHFNKNITGVLTNMKHGEHCVKYQITAIPWSNAFLGIVNQTCNMMKAFCPCSVVDRKCLNCKRMEQSECECPCECKLEMDFCTGDLLSDEDSNPSCPRHAEPVSLVTIPEEVKAKLHQCVPTNCGDRKTEKDCFGVLNCEWCVREKDFNTLLKKPFCTNQNVCFGGVLGAATPYGDQVRVVTQEDESILGKTTPVGPVAGGIMGVFLVLVLGIYCYRHHVHRTGHQYVTAVPDTQVRMSQLDNEPEELEPEEIGTGHTNIVLATFDTPASISPYRVNPNYRRPPAGGDSDHGYSTMTPQDDSEQASMTCIEPLITNKDRINKYKAQQYIGTRLPTIPPPPQSAHRRSRSTSRSPTPAQQGGTLLPDDICKPPVSEQTILPQDPHCVIAPVTVHMVDTH